MLIRRFFLSVAAMAAMSVVQGSVFTANAAEKDIVTTAVEAGSFKTLAGDLAARELSEPGLIASDLPRYLCRAWQGHSP